MGYQDCRFNPAALLLALVRAPLGTSLPWHDIRLPLGTGLFVILPSIGVSGGFEHNGAEILK